MDPTTSYIFITRNETFNEACFPYSSIVTSLALDQLSTIIYTEVLPSMSSTPPVNSSISQNATNSSCSVCVDSLLHQPPFLDPSSQLEEAHNEEAHSDDELPVAPQHQPAEAHIPEAIIPDTNILPTHSIQTRSKSRNFHPKYRANISILNTSNLHHALFIRKEPSGFKTSSK